jgi:hypothetical protein
MNSPAEVEEGPSGPNPTPDGRADTRRPARVQPGISILGSLGPSWKLLSLQEGDGDSFLGGSGNDQQF